MTAQMSLFEGIQQQSFERQLKNRKPNLKCPGCKRPANVWRLSIHSTLARMLINLYKKSVELNGHPDGWVHIEAFRPKSHTSGRDFCIVKHWGLAEAKASDPSDEKRSSGMWSLTYNGMRWLEGKINIDKYVHVFDDHVMEFDGEKISILHALGKRFDYQELWG